MKEDEYFRSMITFFRPSFWIAFILLFCSEAFSQDRSSASEEKYLITHYFASDISFKQQLTLAYREIIAGDYKSSSHRLVQLRKKAKTAEQIAAIQTYEANIAYNESRYARSIELCDSADRALRMNMTHRYALKAKNFKAKAMGALNHYDPAKAILDTVILISQETGDHYNLAAAYYYYGSFYSDLGDYATCASYIKKSIKLREKINDEIGLAACYSFLGLCYSHLDDYLQGIEYIQKSIVIREAIGDKRGLANSYLTLYRVYSQLGEVQKAMDSELKSLAICKELKDLQCVSGRYTNLGKLYQRKGDYKQAMRYHKDALVLSKKLGIKNRTAEVHENMARLFLATKKNDLALAHIDSSLQIRSEIRDREGLASAEIVKAEILLEKEEPKEALLLARSALNTASQLKLRSLVKDVYHIISLSLERIGKNEDALQYFKKFVHLRDSLLDVDKSKELVRQELEFVFSKKEEQQRAEQERREEISRQKNERQRNIILSGTFVLMVVSLLLVFSIYQYRLKNKSQKELELSNHQLSLKNDQLEESKSIIEEQHLEITDSIRYAKQIQSAVLPDELELSTHFASSFVFFRPKDVISGDFYWITSVGQQVVFATVDCTGHGVPGGFMSMLGVSLLNEIVIEQQILDPAEILNRLREKVISSLRQKGGEGEQKDGMDMTLLVYDKTTSLLAFASANQCLYHVSESVMQEFKGDRFPVGIFGDELKPFTGHVLNVKPGDRIYSFSDGYPDQFGGPKGKKFKYQQLKEQIIALQDQPLSQQGKALISIFDKWKGDLEQIDDVTLVGIEI
jgi:serine phosphatase RsbU (regulator of sigma subunit)